MPWRSCRSGAEDLYLGMATVLQQADRQEDMVDLMSEAVAAQPRSATLRVVYLRALAGNGLHDEAREAALQADRDFADRRRETGPQTDAPPAADEALQDPTVEFAEPPAAAVQPDLVPESFLIELADFYALRGEYDRAAGLLEPLYAAGDLDLSPSLWLARIYLGSGRQNDGLRLIEEILERWPDSGRAWYLRGNIAEAAEDGAEALTMYRRAVDLAGDDPEIRLALVRAMLLFWEGDLARDRDSTESRNRLKELKLQTLAASTVVPERDTQGHLILGYAHKTVGQYEAAIGSFRLAARNKDLHLRALIQISICQDEADQDDAARKTLKLLRQEYPDDPEVANSLGYFLAEKDLDLEYAESLVGEALQHDAGNGAYLDSLGWVYYRQGRLDEALDYLIRAVNVLPDDPIILEHLGIVLHEHGRAPEAVEMLQRSLNAGGDRGSAAAAARQDRRAGHFPGPVTDMGAACKRSSSPIRSVVALLIAILLCGPLSGIVAAAGESPPTTPVATAANTAADEAGRFVTTLNLLPWSVAVLSHRLAGSCCWLQSDDGFVRLEWAQRRSSAGEAASSPGRPAEVLAADSRELRDLVHQRGSGWTVVLASDRTGTVNRWQEEWHKTPESLVEALRVVLSTLQQGPAALDAKRASLRTERTAWQPARRTAARRIELTEPLRLAEDAETEPQQRSNPDPGETADILAAAPRRAR